MGCSSTKVREPEETQSPEELRRRLSLSEVDAGGKSPTWKVSQQDGALLTHVMTQNIFDLLPSKCISSSGFGATKGNRYSLGSVDVQDGPLQNSFEPKRVSLQGDEQYRFESSKEQVGFACKKGLKPESPNQDSFIILRCDTFSLSGVFDGHGRKGHEVSDFIKENMPKILLSQETFATDPEKALIIAFERMQSMIQAATGKNILDATRSGSTCSLVLHILETSTLYIAHVGDSRVVLGRQPSENAAVQAVDLTIDHKPDLPAERARIEKAGGIVVFDGGWNYRVFAKDKKDSRGKRYPGLNMSRAMGDLNGFNDAGISCIPDLSKHEVEMSSPKSPKKPLEDPAAVPQDPDDSVLRDAGSATTARPTLEPSLSSASVSTPSVSSLNIDPSIDKFLLIASDGVWEFVTSEEAVQEVACFQGNQAGAAAEHLAALSWERWMIQMEGQVVDDITALVVYL